MRPKRVYQKRVPKAPDWAITGELRLGDKIRDIREAIRVFDKCHATTGEDCNTCPIYDINGPNDVCDILKKLKERIEDNDLSF